MPDSPQYKDTGVDSFWGNYLFEVVVPKDHFLRALKGLFDWQELGRNLILLYEGKGVLGRPPYDPVLLFKMFLLSYLYNLSARDTEQFVRENIPACVSLNLALDQPVPDHSTMSLFKERLLAQTSAQRERLGHGQLGDSVHTQADVNAAKDKERQERGRPPRDPEARLGSQGDRGVKPDGQKVQRPIRYRGYKPYISMDCQNAPHHQPAPRLGRQHQ